MNKQLVLHSLCLLIIVFQLIAITTNEWSYKSHPIGTSASKVTLGLWKSCANLPGTGSPQMCVRIPSGNNNFPKHILETCRIFSIVGVVFIFLGILSMYLFHNHRFWQLLFLSGGALWSLLVVIIWSVKMVKLKDNNGDVTKFKLGYSWVFMLVSVILSVCVVVYFQMGKGQSIQKI